MPPPSLSLTLAPGLQRELPPIPDVRALQLPELRCSECHLAERCLPRCASEADRQLLDGLRPVRVSLRSGDVAYEQGTPFRFLYAVRRGTFKTSVSRPPGLAQVSGFHLSGDLLGLDGLAADVHGTTGAALEDGELCAIPFTKLTRLVPASEGLHGVLGRLMGAEIRRDQHHLLLLGSCEATERLVAFVLDVSRRLGARGFSRREFHLRMSRADIASYLGVTLETVSRTFTLLHQRGLLRVDKRHITIEDPDALAREFAPRLLLP